MNFDKNKKIKQLEARLKVLDQENSILVERAEDFLLLGVISEAVNAESDISAMFNVVLEKMALLKGMDLTAICRQVDSAWCVDYCYDMTTENSCSTGLLRSDDLDLDNFGRTKFLQGADCQAILGTEYSFLAQLLILPFTIDLYGKGFLLLGTEDTEKPLVDSCELFSRVLDILTMNVANRLLLENSLQTNIDLGQQLMAKSDDLRTSEERFRLLIEQTFEAIFLHDSTGRILQVNQRACETLGYSKEELLQMKVADIDAGFDQDGLDGFWQPFKQDSHRQIRSRHRRKSGVEFPVEVNVSRLKLGNEYFYLALVRDLSKQAEVEKLQEQLNLLLDHLPDMVFMLDRQGQLLYLNQAAKKALGNINAEKADSFLADLMPERIATLCHAERIPQAISQGVWIGESQLKALGEEIITALQTSHRKNPKGTLSIFSVSIGISGSSEGLKSSLCRPRRWKRSVCWLVVSPMISTIFWLGSWGISF